MHRLPTLAEAIKNVEVDEARFIKGLINSHTVIADYVILFTARSGSTWLTNLLDGKLGYPGEHLNPEFAADIAKDAGTNDAFRYLTAVRGFSQRQHVFGVEALSDHIELFGEDLFFAALPRIKVFHLWRENLVAQAISLFRATETGFFHSNSPKADAYPVYDADKIVRWMRHLLSTENGNIELIKRRNLEAVHVSYETITVNPAKTLKLFYDTLGIDMPAGAVPPAKNLSKIGDEWSADIEHKFRQERSEHILEIQYERAAVNDKLRSALAQPGNMAQ